MTGTALSANNARGGARAPPNCLPTAEGNCPEGCGGRVGKAREPRVFHAEEIWQIWQHIKGPCSRRFQKQPVLPSPGHENGHVPALTPNTREKLTARRQPTGRYRRAR